jgi:hypothetical protein
VAVRPSKCALLVYLLPIMDTLQNQAHTGRKVEKPANRQSKRNVKGRAQSQTKPLLTYLFTTPRQTGKPRKHITVGRQRNSRIHILSLFFVVVDRSFFPLDCQNIEDREGLIMDIEYFSFCFDSMPDISILFPLLSHF